MTCRFDLIITADSSSRIADFTLLDADGVRLASQRTDFNVITTSRMQRLFDLRNFVDLYDNGLEEFAVSEVGVCIATEVLGNEIFTLLWQPTDQRILRIQLPEIVDEKNFLTAALARLPWEIARPDLSSSTLGERNLIVSVVHDSKAQSSSHLDLLEDEPLRILFVFSETQDSLLLGARRERRKLLELFEQEICPKYPVITHFITHGVTYERLKEHIKNSNGYHIVHWSGHGHLNLLELAKPNGSRSYISGQKLLEIFTQSGILLPRLFFLSTCHSGDFLLRDWNDFLAAAKKKKLDDGASATEYISLKQQLGSAGTAHALLQGGIRSVVAMRYAVSDEYARELAVAFYRALLANDQQPRIIGATSALTMARQSLQNGQGHQRSRFSVCDHATPIFYGSEDLGLALAQSDHPTKRVRNPRLNHVAELSASIYENFAGRTWELTRLGMNFIDSSPSAKSKAITTIVGLGGMGKTALAAEVLTLWETNFDWVFLYQAKPNSLAIEAVIRDIHIKLNSELGCYYSHVKANPEDSIYRESNAVFNGEKRLERLTRNIIRAFREESILLVIDNFETNLKLNPESEMIQGNFVWTCQDGAWDCLLSALAINLADCRSRIIVTCRRRLAALANNVSYELLLGPLPPREAALFLREHFHFSQMAFSVNDEDRILALRLLNASRFHPLLMDRLARLTVGAELRPQLQKVLDMLEQTKDFSQLPILFVTNSSSTEEMAYLEDALVISLDHLIQHASPEARRALWMIATANEAVSVNLLRRLWKGGSRDNQKYQNIKKMLDTLAPSLPPKFQADLDAPPPEVRAMFDALPPSETGRPALDPSLDSLLGLGLATKMGNDLTCHDLVRQRIFSWMKEHPEDRMGISENGIRLAYADQLGKIFVENWPKNISGALHAGCASIICYIQAQAWHRLGDFASALVNSTNNLGQLSILIPHLEVAAEQAPEGMHRGSCLFILADALRSAGRPEVSLPLYQKAISQLLPIAEASGTASKQAWEYIAIIKCNLAGTLGNGVSELPASREMYLESISAAKNSGTSDFLIVVCNLEILRIDTVEDSTQTALPKIHDQLAQLEISWGQHQAGQSASSAPDVELLARALIAALDIIKNVYLGQKKWIPSLEKIDRIIEIERTMNRPEKQIALQRINRAFVLTEIPGRVIEAKMDLENCVNIFRDDPMITAKIRGSLANLFDKLNDAPQAVSEERRALALYEQLPNPSCRADSHHNLANYLEKIGTAEARDEFPLHCLAAFIYFFIAGLHQQLRISLNNFVVLIRRARESGRVLNVPPVAKLLADPAFRPLAQWIVEQRANTALLQYVLGQGINRANEVAKLPSKN